jgi:hypothetical protein
MILSPLLIIEKSATARPIFLEIFFPGKSSRLRLNKTPPIAIVFLV